MEAEGPSPAHAVCSDQLLAPGGPGGSSGGAAQHASTCWQQQAGSSGAPDMLGVRSSSSGRTPCGKQKAASESRRSAGMPGGGKVYRT
jgi:hypothetical protein